MLARNSTWLAVALGALAQTAALGWMVYDRLALVHSGREVVLEVIPVDPRSLFRGDYVILNYKVSTAENINVPDALERNDQVYAVLTRDLDGVWTVTSLSREWPADTNADQLVMQARVQNIIGRQAGTARSVRLRYGIESYFIPEGTGRALERKVQDGKIAAIVAVDRHGRAAIKGLDVAGTRLLDPPLF